MTSEEKTLAGRILLLMGSKTFKEKELPQEISEKIDEAIALDMTIIVGEAAGACRLYQDYLELKHYPDVVVGHARSMRYNAGSWRTVKYGDDLKERERAMIEAADSALVIWADRSGVIAENLELLKRRSIPTFLYEYETKTGKAAGSWLDPDRIYDTYYDMKEYWRSQKEQECQKGRAEET
ncbi:MAG: hypothetical protein HXS41_05780 [Theionarchaea archaeon]|nr:hypothetical protein [Theionarchaea archaeon]